MKDKKFAVIGQLPPQGVAHSELFLANLKANPCKHPLLLYSHGWKDEPDIIRLKADPGTFDPVDNPSLRSNLAFFTGLRIAKAHGLDYFLYLEADCRVRGKHWDSAVWYEFTHGREGYDIQPALMGGTPVCFNPMAWSFTTAQKAVEFMQSFNDYSPVPMAMTGNGHLGELHKPCIFVNGALGIYDVAWLLETFGEELENTLGLSQKCRAWDYELGIRLWDQEDEHAFDLVRPLHTIYSGYADVITCEAQRREWLTSGMIVATHQIKSPWPGPASDKPPMNPSMEIMIVTHWTDNQFLDYALESIEKFASGFYRTTVVVPAQQLEQFCAMKACYPWVRWVGIIEDPKTGFNNHQAAVCCADLYCEGSLILHMDADCIFTEAVTPEDYMRRGLPVMQYRSYENVPEGPHKGWGKVAEAALRFPVTHDFMTRHPSVHWRWLYPLVRSHVERIQGVPNFRDWVLSKSSAFPQGFAEFPTLGGYAWNKFFPDYSWHDVDDECGKLPPNKMLQGWNREGLDHPIHWVDNDTIGTCRARFESYLRKKNED